MVRRPTWVLLAVLGILLVIVFARREVPPAVAEASPTPLPPPLAAVRSDEIGSLRIATSSGQVLSMAWDGAEWSLIEPSNLPGDPARLASVSAWISNLTVITALDGEVEPRDLGLEPPAYLLQIERTDGTAVEIHIGDATPTGSGYYARQAEGAVVVVSQAAAAPLIDLVENPPVLETTPPPPA